MFSTYYSASFSSSGNLIIFDFVPSNFAVFSITFSLDEIYLFCLKKEILNSENIFQILTQNNVLPLTRLRLNQFILNIIFDENGKPAKLNIPNKEIYTYEDILSLNLDKQPYFLNKVLGQKLMIVSDSLSFP
jgi:hypothetical protein